MIRGRGTLILRTGRSVGDAYNDQRDSFRDNPRDGLRDNPRDGLGGYSRDGLRDNPRDGLGSYWDGLRDNGLRDNPRDGLGDYSRDGLRDNPRDGLGDYSRDGLRDNGLRDNGGPAGWLVCAAGLAGARRGPRGQPEPEMPVPEFIPAAIAPSVPPSGAANSRPLGRLDFHASRRPGRGIRPPRGAGCGRRPDR